MIEIVEGFPDNVVGASATGRVTKQDYEDVLIPRLEEALGRHEKVRFYYEIGPEFSGFDAAAAWEDFATGVSHLTRWDRIAVVTDVEWIRHSVNALRFLIPYHVRVFDYARSEEARTWITAP